MSSSFFEVFRDSDLSGELGAFSVSRRWPELSDVYWFFSLHFQPGLRSHSFVSAPKYNTIRRATLQAFFTSFLLFFHFCIHPPVFHLKSVPALTPVQHACGVRLLPVGEGVALYNKESIRRPYWTNGCSLIYNSYFWAYTCLRCSVSFIFSL